MKTRVRHLALFVLLGLFLCPPLAAQAFSPPADSLHFCAFDDYEQMAAGPPPPSGQASGDSERGPTANRADDLLPAE